MMKDVAISAERLSLMIEFHTRGSLTSLDRSMNFYRGSASKVDSLKSSLDVNQGVRRNSNPSIFTFKNSTPNLRRHGSLGREKGEKVYKDSSSSITPPPLRKSNKEAMSTLKEVHVSTDSTAILEETEESSKDEISTVGIQ